MASFVDWGTAWGTAWGTSNPGAMQGAASFGFSATLTAERVQDNGAGRSKRKYQVETRRGVVEVQTLEEVAALLKRAARPMKVVTDEVVVKVKPKTSASALSARLAAAAAEIDDEEFLLLHA